MVRNDIKPDLQTINGYFNSKEFYIPSFQRPYAWKVDQCEQLIEDIKSHKDNFDESSQDNYFFGAILIAQESGEKHENTLIDGQQRTTSFMLLLKAILIKLKAELYLLSEDSLEDSKLIEKLTELRNGIIAMIYNLDEDSSFNYKRNKYQLQSQDIKYVNDSISELYSQDMTAILISEDFNTISETVIKIPRRKNDNKYTNFYKNFRYFYECCEELTNTQIRDFAGHLLNYCQVITITSYDTDQAINIFNSLNGTGVPLTPIEVIVSKATAESKDRKKFEDNWQMVVKKTDSSSLNLNLLVTHYIFFKLSEQNGSVTRNPGIRAFFNQNKNILNDDVLFTNQLDMILDTVNEFDNTELGQVLNKFNSNLKPFVSSYSLFREDREYLFYILRLAVILELTDIAYGNRNFKGFLERINLKYSQVENFSDQDLITEIKNHISTNFNREDLEQALKESGVSNSIIFLNEYLYSKENDFEFNLGENVDIEHIMPKSGLNRENIMKDAGFDTKDEFTEYAEKIGNKILLESAINRGIGDAWFRTKKENAITSHQGYRGTKYKIASSLADYPKDTWVKEDIDKATERAAKRISDFIFECCLISNK